MVAIQLERARLDVRPVGELLGARRRQRQPRRAVEHPEHPHGGDDALRPSDGAHGVGAHRVADGDVSLGREGRDRHGGDVDAEVLHEHHDGAADRAEDALVDDQEVLDDGRQRRRHEQQDVGDGERHQVAVGRRVHAARAPHDDDDHDVADEPDDEDDADEETTDDAVRHRIVGRVGQARIVGDDDVRQVEQRQLRHGRHRCRQTGIVTSVAHDVIAGPDASIWRQIMVSRQKACSCSMDQLGGTALFV